MRSLWLITSDVYIHCAVYGNIGLQIECLLSAQKPKSIAIHSTWLRKFLQSDLTVSPPNCRGRPHCCSGSTANDKRSGQTIQQKSGAKTAATHAVWEKKQKKQAEKPAKTIAEKATTTSSPIRPDALMRKKVAVRLSCTIAPYKSKHIY